MEDLPKYFFHGLIFSTIQLGFALVWDYVIFMVFFGGVLSTSLGLILVLLVGMIVIFGVVNSALARHFWDLNPKNTVLSSLGQGLLILAMFPVFSTMYYFTMLLIWPHNLVATAGLVVALLVFDSLSQFFYFSLGLGDLSADFGKAIFQGRVGPDLFLLLAHLTCDLSLLCSNLPRQVLRLPLQFTQLVSGRVETLFLLV